MITTVRRYHRQPSASAPGRGRLRLGGQAGHRDLQGGIRLQQVAGEVLGEWQKSMGKSDKFRTSNRQPCVVSRFFEAECFLVCLVLLFWLPASTRSNIGFIDCTGNRSFSGDVYVLEGPDSVQCSTAFHWFFMWEYGVIKAAPKSVTQSPSASRYHKENRDAKPTLVSLCEPYRDPTVSDKYQWKLAKTKTST